MIRLLPDATANRIAAGEVVERPAAVVKELVENALDAGARHIRVELEEGGIGRVLVEDDGQGMSPEDLDLCVERHATSKLPEEATLFAIGTLGFRGEALPSIGAVARLSITTAPRDGAAHRITVEGGRKGLVQPASGAPGTRVEVTDLFFATPARRKFLRSARSEGDAAMDALRRLALAWPQVGFEALLEGRPALRLVPEGREARIAAILGADFAAAARPVARESGSLSLSLGLGLGWRRDGDRRRHQGLGRRRRLALGHRVLRRRMGLRHRLLGGGHLGVQRRRQRLWCRQCRRRRRCRQHEIRPRAVQHQRQEQCGTCRQYQPAQQALLDCLFHHAPGKDVASAACAAATV